ncbi:MAG: hypothetical protein ACREFT_04370 [Acetobacteraceae bacterium]
MRHSVFGQRVDPVGSGCRARLELGDAAAADVTATIGQILVGYAERGFLLGVSAPVLTPSGAEYKIVWHGIRSLQVVLDRKRSTLAFPHLLPRIAAASPMYKDLRNFVRAFGSSRKPAHRRINPDKGTLTCRNRRGTVAVVIGVHDGDFDYATRRLLNVAHEIFMVFLADGPYSDYDITELGDA